MSDNVLRLFIQGGFSDKVFDPLYKVRQHVSITPLVAGTSANLVEMLGKTDS